MALGSAIELAWRLKVEGDKQAKDAITSLRQTYDTNAKAIGTSGSSAMQAIGNAAGFGTKQMAAMAAQVPIFAGAIAGAAVSVFALVKHSSDLGSKFHDLSQKTSFSVETLSSLRVAAEKGGTTIDELGNGLVRLVNNLADADEKGGKFAENLRRNGITAFKDSELALAQFLAHLATLSTEEEKVQSASDVFGKRIGASLVAAFNEVGGDLNAFKARMNELGQQMSGETAEQADKLGDRFTELGLRAEGAANRIGTSLAPSIHQLLDALEGMEGAGEKGAKGLDLVDASIGNVIRGAAALIETLKDYYSLWHGSLTLDDFVFGRGTRDYVLGRGDPNAIPQVETGPLATKPKVRTTPEDMQKEAENDARKAEANAKRLEAERERRIKDASDARLEIIGIERDEAARIYQKNVDDEQATIAQRLAAEEAYLKRLQELLAQERDELRFQHENAAKLSAANYALDERANQLVADSEKRRKDIHTAATEAEKKSREDQIQARVNFFKRDDALWEVRDERTRDRIKRQLDQKLILESEALEQLAVVEGAAAIRRQDAIIAEFRLLLDAREEYKGKAEALTLDELMKLEAKTEREKDLQNQLIASEMKRAAAVEEATARINAARVNEALANPNQPPRPGAVPLTGFGNPIDPDQAEAYYGKPPDLSKHFSAFETLKKVGTGALNGITQSARGMIESFLAAGKASGIGVGQIVKNVIAGVAAQSLVQAAYEFAIGVAALTPWGFALYGNPVFHFKSAAMLAAIGGAAALGSLLIPGGASGGGQDAYGASGSTGGGGSSGAAYQPTVGQPVNEEWRGGGRQAQESVIRHIFEVRSNDSHIIEVMETDYRNDGRTRDWTLHAARSTA